MEQRAARYRGAERETELGAPAGERDGALSTCPLTQHDPLREDEAAAGLSCEPEYAGAVQRRVCDGAVAA